MSRKPNPERDEAIERLAEYLNLTPEALSIAQGWSILPEGPQRHVKILIDDYIARQHPLLRDLYVNVSHAAQLRFNSIVEAAQDRIRGLPPSEE